MAEMPESARLLVVGAGAAGMMAAGVAARRGLCVTLVDKNERPGRKLMITGKGRCNVTNNCGGVQAFLANVPRGGRFLYGALTRFGPDDTMAFFEALGVPLKTERGMRVFPQSDRAVDIVDALARYVREGGCRTVHGIAETLLLENGCAAGIRLTDGRELRADAVLLCTGGKSYPLTGSTGDGYRLAQRAGHTVTPLSPSLVPIVTEEDWPRELMGLSLKNVELTALDTREERVLHRDLGEMLFTHFGVSGPLVLSASAHIRAPEPGRYRLSIDLKPGLSPEQLDARLLRDFAQNENRDFANALGALLPHKLIPVAVALSGIPPQTKVNQITREMRMRFAALLKHMELTVRGFRPIEEAIVTSGGVATDEISPKTMESKLVPGLYFAGELLDCDAYTGGFNLQIAFSTGHAAGEAVPAFPET